MVCNKCGKEISDNSIYCNKCGTKIKANSTLNNIFKKKSSKIIACIMLILILMSVGGYNYYSSLPPKNVKSVVYKGTLLNMQILQQHKKDNWSMPTDDEFKNFNEFCDLIQKDANSTPEELAIRKALLELIISYGSDSHNKFIDKSYGEDYNQKLKELQALLKKK